MSRTGGDARPVDRELLKGICAVEQKGKSASEPWPRHGIGRYNEVLESARANGWTLQELSDHGGYRIDCPEGQCSERIYSTPRNGETQAKRALRTVRQCPHNRRTQSGIAVAHEHMDKSELLIDAAAAMIRSRQEYDQLDIHADDYIDDQEIDELLNEAAVLETKAEQALPDGWHGVTEAEAADGAQRSLSEARGHLTPLDRENPSVKQGWERLKGLKGRLKQVREKMGAGGSASS